VNVLQVTNASRCWDVRGEVRETLVAFVQKNYPESLPRLRTTIARAPGRESSVAG
jgi:hypothetical protein